MPQVSLAELVTQVQSGRSLISFPTDTVPALAASPAAAEQIFVAKQRSLDKPLILMGADIIDLWMYVTGTLAERQIWQQVATQYLPGALTLVLPASDRVPPAMNPKNPDTIGLRVPNHPVAQLILRGTGPLATTSANNSGQPPLQTMAAIETHFPQVLTLSPKELKNISDLQPATAGVLWGSGTPSTVVRWTGSRWEIVRQGTVVLDELTF